MCINRLNKSEIVTIFKVACLSVLPVGVSGIMQHFGFGGPMVDRVYSTFGQPNWLAQYLVMLLPFVLFLMISGSFLLWALVFVIGFACLWFTYSLSGILGFIFGFLFFIIIIWRQHLLNRPTCLKLGAVLFTGLLVAATNLGFFQDRVNDILLDIKNKVTLIQKVYALENTSRISDPGFIRFGLWQGSLDLAVSSPKVFAIGTGPETFPYAFQPFRLGSLNYSSEWDFVFNKPHNYYLQLLTEIGVIGFLLYLVLLYWVIRRLPFYFIPGFVGFLITNIFGWPVVGTTLLFWFWVSYAGTEK